ncbi:uncharacterized protein LOC109727380 [Ananas comosus]|uniref:Uncharacterized protein LOC109727380 n=1 Tax=Ananas comosus TaxID=4615 RepID=A0A6P5GZ47_ANACO|nr:uncharacterized protein LOC109727380 [Ananas comosus]
MCGVKRFGIRGKLSPRYVGPFEALERVGAVAYRVELPPRLVGVHNVFHMSNLRKYIRNSSHILEYEPVELLEDMTYEEYPVCIHAREEKKLRNRTISYVKVQWCNHVRCEATWELDEAMRKTYPHLVE